MRYLTLVADNTPDALKDEFHDYGDSELHLEDLALSADLIARIRHWSAKYLDYMRSSASVNIKDSKARSNFAAYDRQAFSIISDILAEFPNAKLKYFSCGFSQYIYDVNELEALED